MAAFVHCARHKGPEKTLFHHISDSGNIVLGDLQQYIEVVCAFFEVSPVGSQCAFRRMFLLIIISLNRLIAYIAVFVVNVCLTPHEVCR